MFRNYLTIAWRHLWKNRFYSMINIFGLALGIASSLILLVFVYTEFNYDKFHPDSAHIYRLLNKGEINKMAVEWPAVGYLWTDLIKAEMPQVEGITRIFGGIEGEVLKGEDRFEEEHLFFVDSNFTDIFHLEWIKGNEQGVPTEPNQALITQSIASKYFGKEDPIGKTITIDWWIGEIAVLVTGIIKDYPTQSHFEPGFLISMSTFQKEMGADHMFFSGLTFTSFYTYLKTKNPNVVEDGLKKLFDEHIDEQSKERFKGIELQALTDIHLHSHSNIELKPNGNIFYVRIFLTVGILILLIAAINYINLTTAQGRKRSKEVGMRKVVGAHRKDIIQQFLGESSLIAILALILALILTQFILWILAESLGIYIEKDYFLSPFALSLLLGVTLSIGLLAGSYPALYLSGFSPMNVLRGSLRITGKGGIFRKILVILQFTISTALIIGTTIIFLQLHYIENKDLGFNKYGKIVVPGPWLGDEENSLAALNRLKTAFQQSPHILNVSAMGSVPGGNRFILKVRVDGRPETEIYDPLGLAVDFDYVPTMGVEILEGRNFDRNMSTDATQAVLINEAAVKEMKLDSIPLNTELLIIPQAGMGGADTIQRVRVIGVFKDMHFKSLHFTVQPMILQIAPEQFFNLVTDINTEHTTEVLAFLEDSWNNTVENMDFWYSFLDEDVAALYEAEEQFGRLVSLFTILTIVIACLGLLGLSAYTIHQRQKEISIRKVMGASVSDIIFRLSKDFLFLLLIAFPIAAILGWWSVQFWLESFGYRTEIGVMPFLLALVLSLGIGFLTISYHAYRAATANPVDTLHNE